MHVYFRRRFALALFILSLAAHAAPRALAGDWAEWRGPLRDGVSPEKNLPSRWSPAGENLAWKVPFGGRSAPIVFNERVYLINTAGKGETLQERIMCFNADTGKLLWEHRFNVYLSDVPPHRVGWASPVGDPATGNVYAFGVGGSLIALARDGKVLWERSLGEDFGLLTTHGGRTVSPIIDGDLVITSGVTSMWGEHGRGAHRFMAFDKRTGETIWVSAPGGRPYDTTYAAPIIADINGTRLLIQGASDGVVHALKPQTGEPVWKYEISKRGLNTGAVVYKNLAIVTHSEENLESNEMGMIAALDATAKGELKKEQIKWSKIGWQGGYSSPVIDGERLYQVDNGANIAAFDLDTGKQLWLQNLGTIQKSSPVFADGKIYVGTENGKFFILKPTATGCEILDSDQLGTEQQPEAIIASPAVSGGRVYFATDSNLYALGKKSGATARAAAPVEGLPNPNRAATWVQVSPTELIIKPGETANFRVRLFDAQGKFIREEKAAAWSLDKLKGTVANGRFVSAADGGAQAGLVKATVAGVEGAARVRVVPPLPWSENFDAMALDSVPPTWVSTAGKFAVRELDGGKTLFKIAEGSSLLTRTRAYMGAADLSNYTIEADVRGSERRRQRGDAGVIAQRYALVLYGNSQSLHLEPWQPETARTVTLPFNWKPDTWYRMKLSVENLPDGKTRARGKVWARGDAEPAAWMIERIDPLPNRQGAPGIFGNGLAELYFDNLTVTANK
ncbi:MAG TPA: PQQ-binding-like beta-propeller repeat protein [Pyrinomonadaceae bacterium]|nr:PQQ-binding-like beta-propeller repeat protein [Pyrinomonadaceae bacterium]